MVALAEAAGRLEGLASAAAAAAGEARAPGGVPAEQAARTTPATNQAAR